MIFAALWILLLLQLLAGQLPKGIFANSSYLAKDPFSPKFSISQMKDFPCFFKKNFFILCLFFQLLQAKDLILAPILHLDRNSSPPRIPQMLAAANALTGGAAAQHLQAPGNKIKFHSFYAPKLVSCHNDQMCII